MAGIALPLSAATAGRSSAVAPQPARCMVTGQRPIGSSARSAAPMVPSTTSASKTRQTGRQQLRPMSQAAAAVEAPTETSDADGGAWTVREDIRNIAIIAHVDHGKTTLVDAMLKQSKVFRENQVMEERIMDSNDLERERGITILSKNTAVTYKGSKINIIDTPGHADFGGEVERVLNMCDGVLLLVDAVEGPMPQTRFVTRKALELNKKIIVVVNKIDRPAARPDFVIDTTFELFCDLGACDDQCDFPVVYASGLSGIAGDDPADMTDTLAPLFEAVMREVSPPRVRMESGLQLLVTNLDYDEHKGRISIGRVTSGSISKGEQVAICKPGDAKPKMGKIAELFVYDQFNRVPVDKVEAGDICALTGITDVGIGETVCDPKNPEPLPTIEVEEPTVRMAFLVNTSPFAGKEGKFVTSRNIKDRLARELERNLALKVEPGEGSDEFVVCGRGTLHIGILIENMRREGYEFQVGPPKVIMKEVDGRKMEPYEDAVIEAPEEHMGSVMDLMGQRKAEMLDMAAGVQGGSRVTYRVPTRALLGLRNQMLTATKGTALLNTVFAEYGPWSGDISMREQGSLVAHETGTATSFAIEGSQQRGRMFIDPGKAVYEGMVVGIHSRSGDLKVNVCREKQLNNIRSATKEKTTTLSEPIRMSLDDALEYIADDELVEVTPESVRIRKNPKIKSRR